MKDTATESQPSTRPIKAIYDYATLGSRTRMGGEIITASTSLEIHDLRIACVGDRVRYPDGKESEIISGAGFAATYKGLPIAIVGSATDNGDTVTSSLQNLAQVVEYADGEGIPGLLTAAYRVESQM